MIRITLLFSELKLDAFDHFGHAYGGQFGGFCGKPKKIHHEYPLTSDGAHAPIYIYINYLYKLNI